MFDRAGNRKYLNTRERRAYLSILKTQTNLHKRTFCLTLYFCGCRISEALSVTKDRVDLAGKAITFETLKQRKRGLYRALPIPDELVDLICSILKETESGGRIWKYSRTTAYRIVKESMLKAEIIGSMACPKGLRHGFAVACVGENIPLVTLQKWLGHGRLETTAIYLDVRGDEERALAKRLWIKDLGK